MATKVITLAKTKELLGISAETWDTEIARYITIIDSKVKLITNNRYNMQIVGDTTVDSKVVIVSGLQNVTGGINNNKILDDIDEYLEIGTLITGTGIAADTYIDQVYYGLSDVTLSGTDYRVPTIELSANATATGTSIILYLGFNIGLQTTIAKGIQWLIDQESTSIPSAGLLSRSIGPTSLSWSDKDAKLDGKYGMPVWFVKAFPVYMSGH